MVAHFLLSYQLGVLKQEKSLPVRQTDRSETETGRQWQGKGGRGRQWQEKKSSERKKRGEEMK